MCTYEYILLPPPPQPENVCTWMAGHSPQFHQQWQRMIDIDN